MCALFIPLLGNISGRIAGNVFSRTRSGFIIRNGVVPVNPNTPGQNKARADLSFFSSAFSQTLTQAQRDGWLAYAQGTPLTNRQGQVFFMTAQQAFVRTNTFVFGHTGFDRPNAPFFQGQSPTPSDETPAALIVHDDTSLVPNVLSVDPSIIFGFDHDVSGTTLAIWTSFPQSSAVEFPPADRKKVGVIVGDSVTPPGITAFPLPAAIFLGGPIFVYLRQSDFFGRISQRFTTRRLAVNVPV